MGRRADRRGRGGIRRALGLLAAACLAAPAGAQPGAPPPGRSPGVGGVDALSPQQLPAALQEVGFDQRLGEQIPFDLPFHDEEGRQVRLGDFFGARPVILVPAYFDCPMLCTLVMNGVATSLAVVDFASGQDFEILAVSFDPEDTPELAREKKALALERYGRPGGEQGWHFLTGDPAAIASFTEAIGFRYSVNEATGEFAHTAGLVVATPEGKISRYFFGLEYPGRDLRLSLVEAADGGVGTLADQVFLFCFRYDPATGKYSALSLGLVRLAGLATVLLLASFVIAALWRERRRERVRHQSPLGNPQTGDCLDA